MKIKHNYLVICGFLILSLLSSCKTIKPEAPAESYSTEKIELQPSIINIPLDMNVSNLETLLNKQLNGLIYESDNLEKDNYAVKAWKKENISIGLEGNVLSYRIPLKLWIKAGFKVSKFGIGISDYREINAEIALKFKTSITLNSDWTVSSTTTTDGYDWMSTPVVKVGPVDIPITFIADRILKANQKTINTSIDKVIAEKLELKKHMQDAWIAIQKPTKVNDEYNIWLKVTPKEILSTPIAGKAGKLRHTIGIESVTEAFIGAEPPYTTDNKLPNLKIQPKLDDDFKVNLVADLPFTKANEMAKKYMNNQGFQQGKYTLTIKDIDVFGSEGKLAIHLVVLGSIKGDLYLTGTPYYSKETQSLKVKDLDFELKTRNALTKTGSWLFHGTLAKMIENKMEFPLNDQLKSAKSLIEENMKEYKLADGIILKGSVDDLSIGDIILTRESIKTGILLNGKVVVTTKL